MSTIVTRSDKGSALTFTEMDNNFVNLNTDKLENISEDPTPQLGGDLDVDGKAIVSANNGNIEIDPNGTGVLILNGLNWPSADGTNGQVITTDGLGQLTFTSASSGLANVVEDTTPQLGGDLDVQSFKLTTSTVNGDIELSPNGTGNVLIGGNLDVQTFEITTSIANGDIDITPNGTGSVQLGGTSVVIPDTLTNPNGNINIEPATANSVDIKTDTLLVGEGAASTEALITGAAGSNAALKLRGAGTGSIIMDDPVAFSGGAIDMQTNSITTSVTDQDINITPNGSGSLSLDGAGLNVKSGLIYTGTVNENLTLNANGTGVIVLSQLGGVLVTETAGSGFGVVTGDVGKGLGLLANGGADTSSDPSVKLTSGGGLAVAAGDTSTLTLTGDKISFTAQNTIELNSPAKIADIQSYAETIDQLLGVSGTLTIDPLDGPIKYLVPAGNITINGFTSPAAGQTVSFLIDQSTNGSAFTLTLGAGLLLPGGIAPTLTPLSNDLLTITCIDPITPVYIANVVNDFQ